MYKDNSSCRHSSTPQTPHTTTPHAATADDEVEPTVSADTTSTTTTTTTAASTTATTATTKENIAIKTTIAETKATPETPTKATTTTTTTTTVNTSTYEREQLKRAEEENAFCCLSESSSSSDSEYESATRSHRPSIISNRSSASQHTTSSSGSGSSSSTTTSSSGTHSGGSSSNNCTTVSTSCSGVLIARTNQQYQQQQPHQQPPPPPLPLSSSTTTAATTTTTHATRHRHHHHHHHPDINADVRLLRKIGYIASRVRFLAKIYGDFRLVNPYSPAKQRRQLQEILLKHSINDSIKELAGVTKFFPPSGTTAQHQPPPPTLASHYICTTASNSPRSSSQTPLSGSAASSYCCLPTESSTTYDDETVITTAAGAVRRTSATSVTAAASILLLEDLLVQFYEDRRSKLTIIRRRSSRSGSAGGGGGAGVAGGIGSGSSGSGIETGTGIGSGNVVRGRRGSAPPAHQQHHQQQQQQFHNGLSGTTTGTAGTPASHLIIMSGQTTRAGSVGGGSIGGVGGIGSIGSIGIGGGGGSQSSSVERLLQMSANTATTATAMDANDDTIETIKSNGSAKRLSIDLLTAKAINANININTTAASVAATTTTTSSQIVQQQRSNSLLAPIPHMESLRRRRASDCSAHVAFSSTTTATTTPTQQQPQTILANQLQVATLKNNNCAKLALHRGSCGAAGEHLIAANSIANRSTIILSKSCSHVDVGSGSGSTTATALYASGDLRQLISGIGGGGGGIGGGGGSNTPTPTTTTGIVTTAAASTTTTTTNGNANGNDYSIVQLNNTIIQCHFNDDDFRALVRELKRKVEYTERMNWLCLSKRPLGLPHRKSSLPKHQEVKKRFLELCDTTFSDEVKSALRLPAFDSYEWSDADIIHLMQTMFIELGFLEKFNIPHETLREWLYEVYKHYNEVPFHNFRHCFCVAQMMYAITQRVNLVERLGHLECLILLVSCICHDLDHPGYNNIYQINARTELALRYNDISPLENHHCSIAFRLLEHPECNIFKHFSRETFNQIREGIIRCILATDMARHNEILTQFKEIRADFDYNNRAHINLLCMVLIKVADISNEARPMDVAEPWLDRLLQEFFAQSAAEKSEGLPVTPFMDPDKVSKPGSQVRFIGLVLLPLFEALGELLPELTELIIIPVRVALDYYKRLNDAQTKSRKSVADTVDHSSSGGGGGGGGTTDSSNASATAAAAAAANNANANNNATTSASGGANTSGAAAGTATGSGGGSGTGAGGSGGGGTGGGGGGSGSSSATGNSGGSISPQMPRSQSGISVKSRRSIPSQKSASRQSVDEPQCMAAELHDLPEGSESGDSETATEVDVAEKTSKFKVDTEGSSNRSKSSHSTSRKSSREKRPSMIGEICSSGQRIRNSYGNIHGYHSNRNHFGSNRAVSLDQYSTNNRRLSDGLQQVISDSNVFYNRNNRGSLEASSTTGSGRLIEDMNMNATGFVAATAHASTVQQQQQLQLNAQNVPNIDVVGGGTDGGIVNVTNGGTSAQTGSGGGGSGVQQGVTTASNGNLSPTMMLQSKQQQHNTSNGVSSSVAGSFGNGSNQMANSKSSWKARFKQFSDYFSFSFDKSGKRFSSTRSSPCTVRNNNGAGQLGGGIGGGSGGGGGVGIDPLTGKPGVCCTISNNLQSPGLLRHKHGGAPLPSQQHELITGGRHRAYSLDVPCNRSNPRYSSSSCGGGDSSRKSSRHDGTTGDENNSNNTLHSSGGAGSEMPTCLPPPIRIGSVDASDTILISTTGLPRVLTPANLGSGGGSGGGAGSGGGGSGSGGGGGGGIGGEGTEPSLSIDLGMASASSSDPPKI